MKMKIFISIFVFTLLMLGSMQDSNAAWDDFLEIFSDNPAPEVQQLTDSEVVNGLKEAITKGVQTAITSLGKENGFYGNPMVRIPMPEHLQKIEDTLRTLKQEKYADEFKLTMNRAAEQAVPATREVFIEAIKNMTFDDAREILNGPDNAATSYFRKSSKPQLIEKILPIVSQATEKAGVTRSYKSMMDKMGFMSSLIDTESMDVDKYVTNKAVSGLFKMIAQEEKLIRNDPAARTTEILKKVFNQP